MKKILSLCVAMTMVFTSIVFATPAYAEEATAIAVNEALTVQFEDYTENFSCAVTTSSEMSNGDVAVYRTELAKDQSFTVDLDVALEGVYAFELKGAHADWLSAYDIMLDDTVIHRIRKGSPAGTVIKDADGNNVVYDGQFYTARKWSFNAYATAGTHTLTVIIYARTTETSASTNNTVAFALDSLSMTYRKANIAKSGKTVVEFEDYAVNANLKTAENGQTILSNGSTTTQPKIYIPTVVEQSGYYHVEYVVGYAKDNYRSEVVLKLDGTTFGRNNDSYEREQLTEGLLGWSGAPMSKYQTQVYLTAGQINLITAEVRITADKQYKYNLDYMAFTPVKSAGVEVSKAGESLIELENYPDFQYTSADGEGTKSFSPQNHIFRDTTVTYLSTGWASYDTLTQTVNLDVQEAGEYELEAVVTEADWLSTLTVAVDGNAVSSCVSTTKLDTSSEYYFGASQFPAVRKVFRVQLAEGEHELTLTYGAPLDPGLERLAFAEDYIKIRPAAEGYTTQYLGDGFTRVLFLDNAFAANTAREFTVDIPEDGSYAVFLQKAETENTDFTAYFTNGTKTVSLCEAKEATDAYAYPYVRLSASADLTKGAWTLAVTSLTDITVSFADVRCVSVPVDGTKQAIYPSDFATGETDTNDEISKETYEKVSGYTYYASYASKSLAEPFAYGRGIRVDGGKNVTYHFRAGENGGYKICVDGFFVNRESVTAGTVAKAVLAMDGNEQTAVEYTYSEAANANEQRAYHAEYDVKLSAGKNVLSVTPDAGFDLHISSVTVESYDPDKEHTYVLAKDEVASYMQAARKAYETSAYADYTTSLVTNYAKNSSAMSDIPKPVPLSWEAIDGVENYTLKVSKTKDFSSDVLTYENIKETSFDVYNLYVDTVYYWKVQGGGTETEVQAFYTDKTVRYIYADGARNFRDIGGWNGLNQGVAFRGAELDSGRQLTEAGRKVMHDDLGIKTDLDFRVTPLTESPIGSDVKFINDYRVGYYTDFTSATYAGAFKTFADIDNYPIYFHCQAGADRTGTVGFVIEALCGVTEADLSVDYELTSFSAYDLRPRYDNGSWKFASTVAKMKTFEGKTLQEKAENALLSMGLTRAEISNIQSILSGNAVVFEKAAAVTVGRNTKIPLKNVGNHTVSKVTVNGKETDFSWDGKNVTVTAAETGDGIITFEDGNVLAFDAELYTSCVTQTLSDGFTRFTMSDTDFVGGETYEIPVHIAQDGDYAVFLRKGEGKASFAVSFVKDGTEVVLTEGTGEKDGYAYPYVRAGSAEGEIPVSASLSAGDWILRIKPAADTSVQYVDVRSAAVKVTGAPQAIYPSDFYALTDVIDAPGSINGQLSNANDAVNGYTYYSSYENSVLSEPFAGDRPILAEAGKSIQYKLNVLQDGTYKLVLCQQFDSEDAQDAVFTVTAGEGSVTKTNHAGNAEPTDVVLETFLSAGEQIVTLTTDGAGSRITHFYLEKVTAVENTCISADHMLTRIEVAEENRSIAAGASGSFDFTVPVDGNYLFYAHIGKEAMQMQVTVKDLETGTIQTVFDGNLTVLNAVKLRRLGMGQTPLVALSANTRYRLYITPGKAISVPFVDVMCADIAISGKTAVAPHYISETDITDAQINCADQANKVIPESGYTLAGNFLSEELAPQSGFNTGFAVTPCVGNNLYFTYTLNVQKAGYYQIYVDAGTYASSYADVETLKISVDDVSTSATYTKRDRSVERLAGPAVYLSEGKHTLTVDNPGAGKALFYMHQILFTPIQNIAVSAGEEKASVSAGFADTVSGTAMIALYDTENRMVGLSCKPLFGELEISVEIPVNGTPASAKVFVWDNLDSIAPITEPMEISAEDSSWTELH